MRLPAVGEGWRRAPLWLRLLAVVMLLLVASFGVTGYLATRLMHRYLVNRVDQQLSLTAGRFRRLPPPSRTGGEERPRLPSEFFVAWLGPRGEVQDKQSQPLTEVGRLGTALSDMLGQIEEAFRAREASEGAARASEERMRQFVADASHELRTPLTSIRGFAELYRQGAVRDEPGVARLLGRIEDEAARMGVLVEDLLLLARLDTQRPLQIRPVDLTDLVTEAVHDARMLTPDRTINLEPVAHPLVVNGDRARLRQVLDNLVGNAVTHTP